MRRPRVDREDNPAPGKTTIHDADQRRIWIYGFENWIRPDANAFNRWAMNNVKRDLISGLRLDNSAGWLRSQLWRTRAAERTPVR